MPMSKLLEQVFEELSRLPEKEQDTVAEFIISFIHSDEAEEAEWEALTQTSESQRFLDQMVSELKEEEAKDGLLPFPGEQ